MTELATTSQIERRQEIPAGPPNTEPHLYGLHLRRVRKILRRNPSLIDHPDYAHVKVDFVRVYDGTGIDRAKRGYRNADLREMRKRNGVGSSKKRRAAP